MKMTITFSLFVDMFYNARRENQFSYIALESLYDHLEEIDPDYDLDVIELCCSYVEVDKEEIDGFVRSGLSEQSFVTYDDTQDPPVPHFFATYTK